MKNKILITGIAGFYGHHLANYLKDQVLFGIDKLDEGGSLDRLKEIDYKGKFYYHDLRAPISKLLGQKLRADVIFHLGAMSHVDRSIQDPLGAVMDNVVGTANILEFARQTKPELFVYFSTDEVFGPSYGKKFKEDAEHRPGSPYSATKAGGEDLALSYHNTYGVPVVITHGMNIFGERQHPEKFIPKVISHLLKDEVIPIYCDKSLKNSGSRSYIYADDVSRALDLILKLGKVGEKYNIEGSKDFENIRIAEIVANEMGKKLKIKRFSSDLVRPGNDFDYGIDGSKLRKMGFKLKFSNEQKIREIVRWYLNNKRWIYEQ